MKEFVLTLLMIITAGCINVDHKQELKNYKDQIDSLERVINDKESEIEILINDLETRDAEISYLGRSLDSLKRGIKSEE